MPYQNKFCLFMKVSPISLLPPSVKIQGKNDGIFSKCIGVITSTKDRITSVMEAENPPYSTIVDPSDLKPNEKGLIHKHPTIITEKKEWESEVDKQKKIFNHRLTSYTKTACALYALFMFKEFSTDTHDICCRISEDVNKGKCSLEKSIIKHYNISKLKKPFVYIICAIIKILPIEKIISSGITKILYEIRSTVHAKDKKTKLIKSVLPQLSADLSRFLQAQREFEEYTGNMSRHDFLMQRMNPSIELLNMLADTLINRYLYKFKIPVIGKLLNRLSSSIITRVAKKSLLGIFNNIMDAIGKKDSSGQYKPSKCFVFHFNSLLLNIVNDVKTQQSDETPPSEPKVKFETNPELDTSIKYISELLIEIFKIESKYHPQPKTRKFCKTGSIIRSVEKKIPRERSPKDIEKEIESSVSNKNMPDTIYSVLDFIIQDGKLVEKTLYGALIGANFGLVPERTKEELIEFESKYRAKGLEIERLRIKLHNGKNLSTEVKSLLEKRLKKEESSFHEFFFLNTPKLNSEEHKRLCHKLSYDRQVSYQKVASGLDQLIPQLIYAAIIRDESSYFSLIKANIATDFIVENIFKGLYALVIHQNIFRAISTGLIRHLVQ